MYGINVQQVLWSTSLGLQDRGKIGHHSWEVRVQQLALLLIFLELH